MMRKNKARVEPKQIRAFVRKQLIETFKRHLKVEVKEATGSTHALHEVLVEITELPTVYYPLPDSAAHKYGREAILNTMGQEESTLAEFLQLESQTMMQTLLRKMLERR